MTKEATKLQEAIMRLPEFAEVTRIRADRDRVASEGPKAQRQLTNLAIAMNDQGSQPQRDRDVQALLSGDSLEEFNYSAPTQADVLYRTVRAVEKATDLLDRQLMTAESRLGAAVVEMIEREMAADAAKLREAIKTADQITKRFLALREAAAEAGARVELRPIQLTGTGRTWAWARHTTEMLARAFESPA